MMALSIRQPWAWLIVQGIKPVENRSWPTAIRGEVLIHAGQAFDDAGLQSVLAHFPELQEQLPAVHRYPLGGIVGVATLVDCVTQHPSRWFTGPYGFVLRDARPMQVRPWPGKLGFFKVPDLAEMQQGLHAASAAEAEAQAGQERLF